MAKGLRRWYQAWYSTSGNRAAAEEMHRCVDAYLGKHCNLIICYGDDTFGHPFRSFVRICTACMKVAIYGGSFDPVHWGHLWVAQGCGEQLDLDQVLFIPTATSPLKPGGAVASNAQRVTMLQLAMGGASNSERPQLVIDQRELHRGGISYTLDTVAELQQERPDDQFFLLIGSDAFASIRLWHRPEELLTRITPVVFRRGGDPPVDWSVLEGLVSAERIEQIRAAAVTLPLIELSSSDIRQRVASGRSIRFLVPHAVAAFIHAESLYQLT